MHHFIMQTNNQTLHYRQINVLEATLLGVVIALPLWPSYLVVKLRGLPGVDPARMLIFLALVLWVSALLINYSWRVHFTNFFNENQKLIVCIMLPFFGWKIATAGLAPNLTHAVFSALRDTIYCFGLFVLAGNIWCSYLQMERVIRLLLITSTVIFFVTVLEVINQHNLFINYVPDSFVSAQRLKEGIVRDGTYRAWGTFAHPIALAGYCTTVLPLTVWYAFVRRKDRHWFSIIVCLFLTVTNILSMSRAGLVVMTFMAAGFLITNYLPKWLSQAQDRERGFKAILVLIISMAISCGAWFTVHQLATGRTSIEAGSTSTRLLQIERGLSLIKASPFTGYGPGEAATVLGLSAKTVDNYYLSLALESGLPELFFFVSIYFYFLFFAWRLQQKIPSPVSGLVLAIFWLVAGNALFLSVVSLEQTLPFVFLMFGMLISISSITGELADNVKQT